MKRSTTRRLAGLALCLLLALPLAAKKGGKGGGDTTTASGLFVRADFLDQVAASTGSIPTNIHPDGNGNCPADLAYEYWDTGNDGPCQGQANLGPGVNSNLSNGGRWKVDDTLPRDGDQNPVTSVGGDRRLVIDFTQPGGTCPAAVVAEFGGDLVNCALNAEVRMSADRVFKKSTNRQPFTIQILCSHPGDPAGNPPSSDCNGAPDYRVSWDYPLFVESDPVDPSDKNRKLVTSRDEATTATLIRGSGATVAMGLEMPIGIRLRRQFCASDGTCTEP